MPTAALGAGRQVGMVSRPGKVRSLWSRRGHTCAYTPGAMVAREWSGLMCLETQGREGVGRRWFRAAWPRV